MKNQSKSPNGNQRVKPTTCSSGEESAKSTANKINVDRINNYMTHDAAISADVTSPQKAAPGMKATLP